MAATDFPVRPGAEPFAADGGPIGILLVHGFTGSPASMRPWAEFLAARGHAVTVVRLPGHGTHWRENNTTTWQDWYAEVEQAYLALRVTHAKVAVCALSMGSALSLHLAANHPVDALVVVNPSVRAKGYERVLTPILKHISPIFFGVGNDIKKPGQDENGDSWAPVRSGASVLELHQIVSGELATVTTPTLMLRSTVDHVVPKSGGDLMRATMPNLEFVELANSFHVATLDHDADEIFERSAAFIENQVHAEAI